MNKAKTLADHILDTYIPMIALLQYLENHPEELDLFATNYPFAESYDEVIAQIAEWHSTIAEALELKNV